MSGYVPKVGDKVRATLGETVIVGRHTNTMHNNGVHIAPEGADFPLVLRINDGWHFEQVVSVPTKFGAVIRRADGKVFCFIAPNQKPCPWLGSDGWWDEPYVVMGGFTVLFEGVDE